MTIEQELADLRGYVEGCQNLIDEKIVPRGQLLAVRIQKLAEQNAIQKKALETIKIRLHFMGWPAEDYWKPGEQWIPDWREEIHVLENALHGTPIDESKFKDPPSLPFNQIPEAERPRNQ